MSTPTIREQLQAALDRASKNATVDTIEVQVISADHWRQEHLAFIGELNASYADHIRLERQAATRRERRKRAH